MMSASEYRARADALVRSADKCSNYALILELEAAAKSWRRLAEVAEWQDAIIARFAAIDASNPPAETPDGL